VLESPKIRQFRHHCHLAARIPVRNPHGHGCRPGSRKHEIHICRRITITSRVKITRLLLGAGSRSLTIPHIGFRSHPPCDLRHSAVGINCGSSEVEALLACGRDRNGLHYGINLQTAVLAPVNQIRRSLEDDDTGVPFNRKRDFPEERFRSVLLEDGEPVRFCAAYIDLNPVRAGLCENPEDYRWCSYAAAMGGDVVSRRGLARAWGRTKWTSAVACEHRMLLFGRGEEVPGGDGANGSEMISMGKRLQALKQFVVNAVEPAVAEDDDGIACFYQWFEAIDDGVDAVFKVTLGAAGVDVCDELLRVESVFGGEFCRIWHGGDDGAIGFGEGVDEILLEDGPAGGVRAGFKDGPESAFGIAALQCFGCL
jgi:hypothetical protein